MDLDLLDTVCSRLAAAEKPIGYAALKKALVKKSGITEPMLKDTIEVGLNASRIYFWGDYARSKQCYWHCSREEFLDQAIVKFCMVRARKRPEIKIAGFTEVSVRARVLELMKNGQLKTYPPLGLEKDLIGSADPASYLVVLREFAGKRLEKSGINPELFFCSTVAGGEGDSIVRSEASNLLGLEERILEALRKMEPEPGIPVLMNRLRSELRLSSVDKTAFDCAVLQLREDKRVYLSAHHHPYGLSKEELDEFVDGGDGSQYVAIALRDNG